MNARRTIGSLLSAAVLAGCHPSFAVPGTGEGDDPWNGGDTYSLETDDPWTLPSDVRTIGESLGSRYDDAPAWSDGAGCTGDLTAGARELRAHLEVAFPDIGRIEGYACRQNTADTSKTSMHGTGRALDIFIPRAGGAADNAAGDPVANWLVENAGDVGVQLVIWDRWKWSRGRSGRRDSAYGGPHPHDDHIHVEITLDAAAMLTPFFFGATPPPDDGGAAPPPSAPGCTDTCAFARNGACDDGGEGSLYSRCELGTDCADCGARDTSAPPPPPPSTERCDDSCAWALDGVCDDPTSGAWWPLCALGTDCSDCRGAAAPSTACTDTCPYAHDGWCDDGGPGASYSVCALGTDCGDCGAR